MRTHTAADVMKRDVLTVRGDLTVDELAAFLTDHEISGAPVVDRNGKPVGVVSVTDIADSVGRMETATDQGKRQAGRGWEDRLAQEDLRCIRIEGEGRRVADIMTPTIYTVPEDTPVCEIAKTMIAGRIHRLFVTRRKRMVGIVTSLDLLGLLCKES